MKNRIISLFAVIAIMAAFSVPSFATDYYASDESGRTKIPEYIESVSVSTESVSIPESARENTYELTPDGNLTLIDDFEEKTAADEIAQKQFLTVTTKSGNTFYIVVDRDGNTDNVYLLNLVDEADLMALINDEEVTVTTTEKPTEEESTESAEEKDKKEDKKSSSGPLLLFVLVAGAGGFAFYWFKVRKAEPKEKNESEDDDDEPQDIGYQTPSEEDYFESEESDDEKS